MKKLRKNARGLTLVGMLLLASASSAAWVSYCYLNYCLHCNSDGFCVECIDGSCRYYNDPQ